MDNTQKCWNCTLRTKIIRGTKATRQLTQGGQHQHQRHFPFPSKKTERPTTKGRQVKPMPPRHKRAMRSKLPVAILSPKGLLKASMAPLHDDASVGFRDLPCGLWGLSWINRMYRTRWYNILPNKWGSEVCFFFASRKRKKKHVYNNPILLAPACILRSFFVGPA